MAKRVYTHTVIRARRNIAVHRSSAASELVFSVSGLVMTERRQRLGGDRVADIVSLDEGLQHNLWWREGTGAVRLQY